MDKEVIELIPRNYQVALLEKCMRENSIIFLPTGTGKTFIALLVMKRMASELLQENHKVTVFLVNTVALVTQHVSYIQKHTIFKCAGYSGEVGVDFWDLDKWQKEIKENQVLVMTSDILANLLRSNFIRIDMINLMIFDECHHAVNDHSMRQIMMNFQNCTDYQPRVIGLTATLLNGNCKSTKIHQEVATLEVTFHAKIATVDGLETVVGYATNPREEVIAYKIHSLTDIEKECMEHVREMTEIISQISFPGMKGKDDRLENKNLVPLDAREENKKIKSLLNDLSTQLELFGIHGGQIACYCHKIEVEKMKRTCDNAILGTILNFIETILDYIIRKYDAEMSWCANESERFKNYSSEKTLKLVEILDEFKRKSPNEICGLIFVQRRSTAQVLYHVLDTLRKSNFDDYSYIRPNFITGCNKNLFAPTREYLYLSKKNKEILDNFIDKEINVLIATNVLEEGIDIPKCTFVCKFDYPNDYRSYIQSKGRARHRSSFYYIMVDQISREKFMLRYKTFKETENILNELLIGVSDERDGPCKEDIEEMYSNALIPPYYTNGPGSAHVSLLSAIPLLCRYCQSLSGDIYTDRSPEWFIDENTNEVQIYLPIVCPLVKPITGKSMPTKKLAKRAAAYNACVKLHQIGEFDDSLMPVGRAILEEDVSFLFKHHLNDKQKGVGLKKIRAHDIQASVGKNLQADQEAYLHVINLKPLFHGNDFNSEFLLKQIVSHLTFGLLSPTLLPETFTFPIYTSDGTIMVNILENVRKVRLSETQLAAVRKFHFTVFDDVLELTHEYLITDLSENSECLLLVPVKKSDMDIDFDLLTDEDKMTVKTSEDCLHHDEKLNLKVENGNFENKIVIPYYRRDVKPYLVTKICFDKTPESKFPNNVHENFVEYFTEKHNVHIVNRTQPLLYVTTWSQRLNLFKPPGIERKRKKEKIYEKVEEFLIPETLVKQEFPAELWIQARFLPSILFRLSYILRVSQLWRKIGNECNFPLKTINMKPLEINMNLVNYETALDEKAEQVKNEKYHQKSESSVLALLTSSKTSLYNKDFHSKVLETQYPWKQLDEPIDINRSLNVTILDIEAYVKFVIKECSVDEKKDVLKTPTKFPALTYHKGYAEKSIRIIENNKTDYVELVDLYEALTTAKSNDIVNLERLETLGDSFLKYVASHYIVMKFPKYDEGQATQLKGRIVSNKNLFYLGQTLNIGGIMKNRDLNAKEEWLPPGFCVPQILSEAIKNNTSSPDCLFYCGFTREQRLSGNVSGVDFEGIIKSHDRENDNNYHNMEQFLKQQFLKDKNVADAVEAILGAYLEKTGIEGCLKVFQWMGIIPKSENLENFLKQPPLNPLLKTTATISDIKYHLPFINEIEKIIGYTFKNKAYVLQAFTHASYTSNRITYSYERLEFLGDAILDFLITCFIYESCDYLTPGALTDLRSSLVNNNTFGSYVVRLGLHKFILLMNSKLQTYIDKFDEFMSSKNFEIDDEVLILLQEGELNMAEYVDVPKALGDVFEALAGAIFLDSGYKLDTVWKVFYKIMWKEIESFSRNVPKNPVRRLYECPSAYPLFGKSQATSNNRVMMKLQFYSEGRPKFVHGFGANKVEAKKAAAKMALRYL